MNILYKCADICSLPCADMNTPCVHHIIIFFPIILDIIITRGLTGRKATTYTMTEISLDDLSQDKQYQGQASHRILQTAIS